MIQVLRWSNLLLVMLTLLAYLSPYIHPKYFSWLGILAAGFPLLVLFHFLFLIFWVWQRKNYWWYSTLAILTGFMHLGHIWGFHTTLPANSDPGSIRVATYNIGSFFNPVTAKPADADGFNQLIRRVNPDVLCLQEFALKKKIFDRHLNSYTVLKDFPYYCWLKGCSVIIFSKYPFANTGKIDIGSHSNSCIYGDITINGMSLRVYALHLQSNKITLDTEQLAEQGDLSEGKTWKKAKRIVDKVRNVAAFRAGQAALIKAHQQQSPVPALICGDFNDTPLSYTYHLLSDGMQDAFLSSGSGGGFTYSGKFPFLTLDYILADERFRVADTRIFRAPFSDHYLLSGTVELRK